jgi:hypothetical protein
MQWASLQLLVNSAAARRIQVRLRTRCSPQPGPSGVKGTLGALVGLVPAVGLVAGLPVLRGADAALAAGIPMDAARQSRRGTAQRAVRLHLGHVLLRRVHSWHPLGRRHDPRRAAPPITACDDPIRSMPGLASAAVRGQGPCASLPDGAPHFMVHHARSQIRGFGASQGARRPYRRHQYGHTRS